MSGARQWLGGLLLRVPGPVRAMRDVPVLGGLIHKLSHQVVPRDQKVWAQIEAGPGKGLWLELNPRTGQNYLRGEVEAETQRILVERLRTGTVFYDLGANIGLFSLLASRSVGPAGKVFSFEPDPETAERLRRNIARNACDNARVIQKGLWSTSGKQTFTVADHSSPDHGVGKFGSADSGGRGALLECVALDDFCESESAPDAIKCDVEGAEVEVLRGAERTLRTRHPWIVCELHSEENGRAVRQLLNQFGYRVEPMDAAHVVAVEAGQT